MNFPSGDQTGWRSFTLPVVNRRGVPPAVGITQRFDQYFCLFSSIHSKVKAILDSSGESATARTHLNFSKSSAVINRFVFGTFLSLFPAWSYKKPPRPVQPALREGRNIMF